MLGYKKGSFAPEAIKSSKESKFKYICVVEIGCLLSKQQKSWSFINVTITKPYTELHAAKICYLH